jgi:hypothetical protein
MTIAEPTRNTAAREFTWRARALERQVQRAEQLASLWPADPVLGEIRDLLAAAVQRCERGEVGAGEADALATLARLTLDCSERALAPVEGR